VPPFYAKDLSQTCEDDWKKDLINDKVHKCASILEFKHITLDSQKLVDLDSCNN
jgi:hypothetical protein